jgi:Zn ribbon nucleic-acid-binding protein
MAISDLSQLEYKLGKRGFRLINTIPTVCPKCKKQEVAQFAIYGRSGGRDIELCQSCGHSQSWRKDIGQETRTLDETFDLRAFLA